MWNVAGIEVVEKNQALVFTLFFFGIIAYVVLAMRMYTRVFILNNVGIDDGLMCVAMFGSIAFTVASLEQVRFGVGAVVQFEKLENFLLALYATVVSYATTQMIIKFSILFQYRRIFQTQAARKITFGILIWFSCYGLACVGTSVFTCVPPAKYWHDALPGACIDRQILHYFLAGFNIFNDFILLFLPMPFLKRLNVNTRVRAVLIAVFACGAFACIVAIIRLRSLHEFQRVEIQDQPLVGTDIAMWSGLELNIAMICGSVPSLKPLFIRIFPKLGSSGAASNGRSGPLKPSAYGKRSNGGSVPLHSFDNIPGNGAHGRSGHVETIIGHDRETSPSSLEAGRNTTTTTTNNKLEIKVQQTFEMRTLETEPEDDGSEKDLVTATNKTWTTSKAVHVGQAS